MRIALASAMLLIATACQSSSAPAEEIKPFYALSVKNLAAMSDWYAEAFELEVVLEAQRPPPDGPVILLNGPTAIVELQQRADSRDVHDMDGRRRNAHTVMGVFKIGLHVADIDQTLSQLQRLEVPLLHGIVQLPASVGLRTFAVHDPEGNVIQFFGE